MSFLRSPRIAVAIGALVVATMAIVVGRAQAPELIARLGQDAQEAIAEAGAAGRVDVAFISPNGAPSRHPLLRAEDGLGEALRDDVAKAVGAVPNVGGVRWADSTGFAESQEVIYDPLHCQEDVEALLRARTIRFEESSATISAASATLIDEVATALRPCLGSIIAVTGHTDSSGPEPGNIALSTERALAVRNALIDRGIPADGLRARGVGSAEPAEGLPAEDPANRRIEFSVLATQPITPTPVDTPGPR